MRLIVMMIIIVIMCLAGDSFRQMSCGNPQTQSHNDSSNNAITYEKNHAKISGAKHLEAFSSGRHLSLNGFNGSRC